MKNMSIKVHDRLAAVAEEDETSKRIVRQIYSHTIANFDLLFASIKRMQLNYNELSKEMMGRQRFSKDMLALKNSIQMHERGVNVFNSTFAISSSSFRYLVLVVDDEDAIRKTATMMLEHMGFDTLTAEDGEQCVEIYRQHQHDIVAVLLDMTMPKLDGRGCFVKLRCINKDVRVVLSSGYNENDATDRFIGKGLAGFIQKPYAPEALQITMKQALDGSLKEA